MRRLILILIIVIIPSVTFARVDVNVYDETVYLYLDKLAADGLLKTYMPNQRPLSRYAVARLILEAKEKTNGKNAPDTLFVELESEFSDELDDLNSYFVPIDEASLSYTATNQQESPMPANGLGTTNGRVQPLLSYKRGDHFDKYANFYFSTSHWFRASPYFAVFVQPKFYSTSGDDLSGGIGLYRGYLKTGYRNFEFLVGRDDLRWGPGENSLFFSDNARGLDMIKLSTPYSFRLPWFLKYLGQFRATAFFAWMEGRDYQPANAILSGYRVDYNPFTWWNIGFDHAVFMGGAGAKDPTAVTAIGEFIGFLFDSGNSRASSNHQMGMDATFQIPPLMGMQVYGKLLLEDTQAEYKFMLGNDASWLGGVYFPKLNGLEKLSLRGEFIYTGQFAYRHGFYSDGFTLDGKFIGYDSGSDTYSGVLISKYQFDMNEFIRSDIRYLQRSSDHYTTINNASGNNTGIAIDINGPEERHYIIKLAGQKRLSKIINLYGEVGFDRVQNVGFVNGASANDFSLQLKFIFHDLSKKGRTSAQ